MALRGEKLEHPTYKVIQTMVTEGGSTGVCYRARHEIFDRDVAQKTISLLGLGDAASNEPKLLRELRHDHLVEVWEAQWDPDPEWKGLKAVTFVMPFYAGGSIAAALLEGHRFSVGEAVTLACGVLDALHYLHVDRGLLHRDVKPGNVFLDEARTRAFLGDLGSAAPLGDRDFVEARGGTPLYRPPESHTGRYTVQGDLYSTGLVLLEALNGPFPYATLDLDDVDRRVAEGRHPVPASFLRPAPHVPPSVSKLVRQLINPDPRRRPTSAHAAQRRLQHAQHMDWRPRADGNDLVWDGRWPADERDHRVTRYEIRASPVASGSHGGELQLRAQRRGPGGTTWRGFGGLKRFVRPSDTAGLEKFFRDVEVLVMG